MKNQAIIKISLWLLVSCNLLFFSCNNKKFDDALPKLTLESVESVSADSVALIGKISSNGVDNIEYYGFSFSQNPSFSILVNQTLIEGSASGTFRKVVYVQHDSTYFFKAFAANSFGFTVSNTIEYKVPSPKPVVVPCTLTKNYMNDSGSGFSVNPYGDSRADYGQYQVTINSRYEDIRMYFPYKPINGVYTTTIDGSNIKAGEVYISITKFYYYIVDSGGKVYVNVDSQGNTSISICGVKYDGYNLYGNASFQ